MSYPHYGPSAYGAPPQTHPHGTTILVLGILSLVVCTFIGPFAWVMGNTALREIDESGHYYDNRSAVQAGRICGIISSAMLILVAALIVTVVGLALITGGFSS
ncbi:hypothetical protein GCM10022419_030820 [Nonomuraea rosea]|uniref:DUF4190 domain-containing protein n=2 Tax=Nonomuraea rosea TaxID=638574 RepID=A0ABP6WEN3_9ACTN